jgi:hypothetical protein
LADINSVFESDLLSNLSSLSALADINSVFESDLLSNLFSLSALADINSVFESDLLSNLHPSACRAHAFPAVCAVCGQHESSAGSRVIPPGRNLLGPPDTQFYPAVGYQELIF